jgi:hypothetical protein
VEDEDMQGDIYQLDLLTATKEESNMPTLLVTQSDNMAETTGPKPTVLTSDSEVAIYNEDDLSHLLYINNANNHSRSHHHHHHHHHLHAADKKPQNLMLHPYSPPITILSGVTNPDTDMDMDAGAESDFSSGSDCASFSGVEYGSDAENSHSGAASLPNTPITPRLPFLPLLSRYPEEEHEEEGDEAVRDGNRAVYRRKERRNAFSVSSASSSSSFDEVFDVPVFLGRQAEEEHEPEGEKKEEIRLASGDGDNSQSPPPQPQKTPSNPVTEEGTVYPRHVDNTSGPLMSWWPAPIATMEDDWSEEEMEWVRETEKEIREADQVLSQEQKEKRKFYNGPQEDDGDAAAAPAADKSQAKNIEGPLVSWWPGSLEHLGFEWSV